jgi:hypothetical protein
MKLGDALSIVATPIARAIGADCIDPETQQLRPESNCAKAKQRLNNGEPFFTVMYDRFFEQRTKGEKVKYILQVEVEADDLADAMSKRSEGKVIAGNPRPTPPVPIQRTPIAVAQPPPKA